MIERPKCREGLTLPLPYKGVAPTVCQTLCKYEVLTPNLYTVEELLPNSFLPLRNDFNLNSNEYIIGKRVAFLTFDSE